MCKRMDKSSVPALEENKCNTLNLKNFRTCTETLVTNNFALWKKDASYSWLRVCYDSWSRWKVLRYSGVAWGSQSRCSRWERWNKLHVHFTSTWNGANLCVQRYFRSIYGSGYVFHNSSVFITSYIPKNTCRNSFNSLLIITCGCVNVAHFI